MRPEGELESDVGIVHTNTGLETLTWSCIRSGINSSKTNSVNEIPPACYENVYSQRDRSVSGRECFHVRHGAWCSVLFSPQTRCLMFWSVLFCSVLLPPFSLFFFPSLSFFYVIWFDLFFFCFNKNNSGWTLLFSPFPVQAVHESGGAQWVLEEGPVHCW